MVAPRDAFPPSRVRSLVDEHDRTMRDARDVIGLTNAIYLTRFWDYFVGWGKTSKRFNWTLNGTEIEVNRIWKEVEVYGAALYPRANRATCSADPHGRGDPRVGTLTLNAWWQKRETHRRVTAAVIMALLFPGCAFKVGYDAGPRSPIERAWLRILPPWEVVLDRNATDLADERYRGHVYDAPIEDIVERFPRLRGKITGRPRTDYFSSTTTPTGNGDQNPDADSRGGDGDFVRVLEFVNLRDRVAGKGGDVYRGRLEVWILDQGNTISESPIAVHPLPFADADGRPLPNIEPLIFANEPGYPLRAVAPIERLIPQQRELNIIRTKLADMTRRDARKGLLRKGAIGQEEVDKLMDGVDGNFALVEDPNVELKDILHILPHMPISTGFIEHMKLVEADFQKVAGSSPNARGEITKATAYEVQQTQLFTESTLGFHGLILNDCLVRVARVAQRAIIGAMLDGGDSEGGYEEAERVDEAVEGETPATPDDADKPPPREPSPKLTETSFTLEERGKPVEVTVKGLDGDFEISFVEGGRTPLTDQAMLEFLTGPGITQYMALWDVVQKGGPQAVIAERTMMHIAERADLPKDLHVEELRAALEEKEQEAQEAKAKQAAEAPPVAEPVPTPAPSPGTAALLETLSSALQALQSVADMGPELKTLVLPAGRALVMAMQGARDGNVAALQEGVSAALEALGAVDPAGVPPEAGSALQTAASALAPVAQAMAGETPEAPPPPQPAPA